MILCSGCFDGLHAGHVRYLQRARALADRSQGLVVAIAPDAYIEATKGRAAYWPQSDRAHTVFALGCVDEVMLQDTLSVAPIILARTPRIFAKGPDWRGALPADVVAACHDVDCRIVFTETPGKHVREARR